MQGYTGLALLAAVGVDVVWRGMKVFDVMGRHFGLDLFFILIYFLKWNIKRKARNRFFVLLLKDSCFSI